MKIVFIWLAVGNLIDVKIFFKFFKFMLSFLL